MVKQLRGLRIGSSPYRGRVQAEHRGETQGWIGGVKIKKNKKIKKIPKAACRLERQPAQQIPTTFPSLAFPAVLPACAPSFVRALYFPFKLHRLLPPTSSAHTRALSQHTKHSLLLNMTLLSKAFSAVLLLLLCIYICIFLILQPAKEELKGGEKDTKTEILFVFLLLFLL